MKLLLIEDTPDDAEVFQEVLAAAKSLPAQLEWATTVADGIAALRETKFDLVVTDLALPDAKGIQAVQMLRAVTSGIPIVVLTSSDEDKIITEAIQAGAQDFLVKGYIQVYRDLLPRTIRYAIERKRAEEKEKALMAEAAAKEFQRTAELSAAYRELQQAQNMLIQSEKLAAVGQLASGIAHEVKNPLNIILQCVNYLEPELKNLAQQLEVVQTIRQAVKAADKIIRGLLDFSKPVDLTLKPMSLGTVIEDALTLAEPKLAQKKIHLTKEIAADLPDVLLDPQQMQQVLINVILNASDAMQPGGALSIRCGAQELRNFGTGVGSRASDTFRLGQMVVICEVQDTGSGIRKDDLSRMFSPFFTTKPPGEGVGLGLWICAAIVQSHRGMMHIVSEEGAGTTVRVILPLATESDAARAASERTAREGTNA